MARNGAGTFAVLNPIVVGALRSSSAVNANFIDMGDEITNSLPINGEAGMSGQLKVIDGSAIAPGMAFDDDTNLGFRRSNPDEMKWVAGGTDRATMDANGKLTLPGALSVATDFTKTGGIFNPQTLAGTGAARLTMRLTTNDTTEREIASYQSGSGSGAKGSLRVVGGGANDVATMRFYVNDVMTFQWTGSLFTYGVDVGVGLPPVDSTDLLFAAAGYIDFPEREAANVSAPASNVARLYAKDDSGTTKLYVKDAAGTEIPLQRESVRQVFTASGTWTKPTTGQTMALVEMWGGGGSGGSEGGGDGDACGGGGGSYSRKLIALASISASVAITVGAGGAASVPDGNGNAGGTTAFGSYLSAFGGGRGGTEGGSGGGGGGPGSVGSEGTGGGPLGTNGANQWGSSGDSNPFGGAGQNEDAFFGGGGGGDGGISAVPGGDSVFGGGGGGGVSLLSTAGAGGNSIFGGNGGGGGADVNGTAGTAPGGGGGGAANSSGLTSGAGARGEVRVTCW
jgi:hypothetical protein